MTDFLRDYELIYVIRPTAGDDEAATLIERLQGWISGEGGEVQKVHPWGRRRLAYPINTFREGTYVAVNFKAKPTGLKEVERNLKLSEDVIRYLLIRQGT